MGNLGRAVQELLVGFEGIHMDLDFESGAMVVAAYIFMSLGLFAIAKNRRIQNPWLAWIPVGNLWLLGCISDQYRYVALGQKQNRRKRLLLLSILEAAAIPLAVLLFLQALPSSTLPSSVLLSLALLQPSPELILFLFQRSLLVQGLNQSLR